MNVLRNARHLVFELSYIMSCNCGCHLDFVMVMVLYMLEVIEKGFVSNGELSFLDWQLIKKLRNSDLILLILV